MEKLLSADQMRVCVTGGTGFLASWLIKRLLQDGYFVNTTVRSNPPGSRKDVSYLTNLHNASERLQIFDADLNKPETFEAPIKGCIGVFHVAHPMDFGNKESIDAFTEKTVKASLGILQACVDSKTVKKVVYTSSVAAVMFNGKKHTEVVDEESWSDVDYIRSHMQEFGAWYHISKTLTEKATLDFCEKRGLDVVTVLPSFIHGPFLGPRCPESVRNVMAMIFGETDKYMMLLRAPFVHVDDAANAHIHLFNNPDAKGRYICSKSEVSIEELYKLLSTRYPEYKIPDIDFLKSKDFENMIMYPRLASEKLLATGFCFKYGIEEMYDDAIDCCKRNNML